MTDLAEPAVWMLTCSDCDGTGLADGELCEECAGDGELDALDDDEWIARRRAVLEYRRTHTSDGRQRVSRRSGPRSTEPDDPNLSHGNGGYKRGCRCDECRDGNSVAQAAYRRRTGRR